MTVADLVRAAHVYQRMGLRVFPTRGKIPRAGTRGCHDATTDADEIQRMVTSWRECDGIAIATGEALVVIDVDAEDHEIIAHMPPTRTHRTPRGGWHFFFLVEEEIQNSTGALADHVDVRGRGGYVVAPPSPGYVVVDESPIARAPAWLVEWASERQRKEIVRVAPRSPIVDLHMGTSRYGARVLDDEARRAAEAPEGQRNDTLARAAFRVGRRVGGGAIDPAVAVEAMTDAGIAAGLPEREAALTAARQIVAGARMSPTAPIERTAFDLPSSTISEAERVIDMLEAREARPTKARTIDDEIERVHDDVAALGGLCGSWCSWLSATSVYRQPGLSVGALVALGSALTARRLTSYGLTTAAYVVGVADSGAGKSRPQQAISDVLRTVWAASLGASDVTSSKQVMRDLAAREAQGHGLCLVLDEYGHQLAGMLDARATHRSDMRQLLLALSTIGTGIYTASSSVTSGKEAVSLTAPSLTIYGSSTPSTLKGAVSSSATDDGLTARHLWMPALSVLPRARDIARVDAPADVLEGARGLHLAWQEWQRSLAPVGRHDKTGEAIYLYRPQEVISDPGADQILSAWRDELDDARRAKEAEMPKSILARGAEQARRVAMILSALSRPNADARITDQAARVAVDLVRLSIRVIGSVVEEHGGDSPHERVQRRILAVLERTDGWTDRRAVTRAIRSATPREITDAVHHLAEAGVISVEEITPEKGGRSTWRIRKKDQ